jgi:hypothetical protein
VGLLDDEIAQDNFLESPNCGSAVWGPNEGCVLLCELGQGLGNVGEALDEGSLVTKNAKCATDLFYCGKLFQPSGQSVSFRWVDADGTIADDDA